MDSTVSRRDVLGTALAAGVSVLLMPATRALAGSPAEHADGSATGMVYDDTAGNGVHLSDKKGIPGVLVSNGRDVVRTDAHGAYRIPVADGDVLFVIKPSQWMTPLSEFNLPKFYYFHRPTGSPQFRPNLPGADTLDPTLFYKGSAPTGPLPASIDFPLHRRPEPDEFKVVVFGDTQVSHDHQLEWMSRDTLAELVNAPGVAFGLSVGDLVNVGLLHLFEPLNELQVKTGFPWYVIPGNHDQNLITPDDYLAHEQFRSVYGPTMYAFDYGPVSFLMLENIRRNPTTKLNVDKKGNAEPGGDDYGIGLREDQWQFIENYLKHVPTDRQLVICMHAPVHGSGQESAFGKRLMKLISGRSHTLSISGHTHINRHTFHGPADGFTGPGEHHHFNTICVRGDGYRGMFDELQIPTCQAVDGTPNGYSTVNFTKTGYTIRYKSSRQPADYQMNIFVPPRLRNDKVAGATVLANVFAGSPRSIVRMRINGGDWLPMKLTPQPDPSMTWVLEMQKKPASWLGSKYNRDSIPDSYHIWQASLPHGLKDGAHTLEVETTDMFRQTDRAMTMFRVLPA